VVKAVEGWLRDRRADRPFFLFVNVLDAHGPYTVRRENRFLPAGVDAAEAAAVPREPRDYLCRRDVDPRRLGILRGLYLGGVATADAKLAAIRARLASAGLGDGLVTIATADHGEHLGERRLLGHQFSVRDALLHVPLVVHGLPRVAPAVIDAPVRLADVMPTVLDLAGIATPPELAGRPLPRLSSGAPPTDVVAEHDDSNDASEGDDAALTESIRKGNLADRGACGADDRVFGAMRALVRYPLKLVWYAKYAPELYDLAADPEETRNLAPSAPTKVAELAAALGAAVGAPRSEP
jgi:arylsulfatase A-like enzyme